MKKNKTIEGENPSFDLIDNLVNEISPEEQKLTDRKMLLAVRIDKAMKSNGIKKGQLANMLKKQPSEVTKWLSGTHNFTTETLWEIGDVLNIELIKIQEEESEPVIYIANTLVSNQSVATVWPSIGYPYNLNVTNMQEMLVTSN